MNPPKQKLVCVNFSQQSSSPSKVNQSFDDEVILVEEEEEEKEEALNRKIKVRAFKEKFSSDFFGQNLDKIEVPEEIIETDKEGQETEAKTKVDTEIETMKNTENPDDLETAAFNEWISLPEITLENMNDLMERSVRNSWYINIYKIEDFASKQLMESPANIPAIYRYASKWENLHGLNATIEIIQRRFTQFTKCEDIDFISFEQMLSFLKDDTLRCREDILLDFVIRWLYKKPRNLLYASKLLKYIRFGLISKSGRQFVRENLHFNPVSNSKRIRYQRKFWNNVKILMFDKHFKLFDVNSCRGNTLAHSYSKDVPDFTTHASTIIDRRLYIAGRENTEDIHGIRVPVFYEVHLEFPYRVFFKYEWEIPELSGYDMTACDDYIYIAGGYDIGLENESNSLHRFCVYTKRWKRMASMISRRDRLRLVTHNGYLYAVGGYSNQSVVGSIERYNPYNNKWTMVLEHDLISGENQVTICQDRLYILNDRGFFFSYDPFEGGVKEHRRYHSFIPCITASMIGHEVGVFVFHSREVYCYVVNFGEWKKLRYHQITPEILFRHIHLFQWD